jgi:gamma-glutamylcyclotransferase (GGCT)/AIG2-like uncharacterized protein YtfP
MNGFNRPGRARVDLDLSLVGRGWIRAALFDVGIYPAAVPDADGRVRGELHLMKDAPAVLRSLDEIEGYEPDHPDRSLYLRVESPVWLDDGTSTTAWVYFYNAPLGRASRIESGDYREYLKMK